MPIAMGPAMRSPYKKRMDKISAKLEKPGYTDKAPAHLVEKDRAELAELQDKMAKISSQLQKYRS